LPHTLLSLEVAIQQADETPALQLGHLFSFIQQSSSLVEMLADIGSVSPANTSDVR
jgi:hypothetical protein